MEWAAGAKSVEEKGKKKLWLFRYGKNAWFVDGIISVCYFLAVEIAMNDFFYGSSKGQSWRHTKWAHFRHHRIPRFVGIR